MATSTPVTELAKVSQATLFTLAEEVKERDRRHSWTNEHELLARLHEQIQLVRIEQLIGIGVKAGKLPPFVPIDRPGDEPPVKDDEPETLRVYTARDLAAMTMRGG